jgi:hypothetical protein
MTDLASAPPASAFAAPSPVSGSGIGPKQRMLELPQRGDELALRWWRAGVAAYAVLAVAFLGGLLTSGKASLLSLFGLGERVNVAIAVLVGSGVSLTFYAAWRVRRDIRIMAREEADVSWVHRTGKEGLLLVFVDPKKREAMLGKPFDIPEHEMTVETLMDDRVRRVRKAAVDPEAGAVATDDLKGVADVRMAQLGSFARYASSLLLLLAVLGTFAGVKTALPGLIESITISTSGATSAQANEGLIKSLNAVAEAFGGNALALIGSIAVGLMAQGVGFGRRNLLERLELVSAEFVYGQNVTADANPMQAAMVALRDTAREMHSASGAMLGIEDQLRLLGREFRTAFEGLSNRLHDITVAQEDALYAKTSRSLESLQQRVNELADSVEANARTYAGLAEAVKTRSQESSKAFDAMADSNKQLGVVLESIVKTGERSRTSVDELSTAVGRLTASSDQVLVGVQRVAMATEAVAPSMQQLESTLGSADRRLAEAEHMAQDGWRAVGADVAKQFNSFLSQHSDAGAVAKGPGVLPASAVTADPQSLRLLEVIASRLDQLRPPPPVPIWRTSAPTVVGILVAVALLYAASFLG